jgi:TPR repeat protein
VRAALLVLAACLPTPAPSAPTPPVEQGCPDVPACTALADDALTRNDIPHAIEALDRACGFGDMHSCAREGIYLMTNPQHQGDAQRAQVLLTQACDGNDSLGCEKLAATQSDQKAAQLYDKACGLGDNNACGMLAPMLQHGTGTAVDHARAVQLAQQACESGAAVGCTAWGESYAEGWNGAADTARAAELLTKACEMNEGRACAALASLTTDPADAARLRAKACANGYQSACPSP